MICYYWYFKDIGCKYQPYIGNGCHDFSMFFKKLDDFVVLRVKTVSYRSCIINMSKKDAISLLNKSVLDNKKSFMMDFGTNKTPVEIIREGAFGGTYIKDIYAGVNDKWKKLMERI